MQRLCARNDQYSGHPPTRPGWIRATVPKGADIVASYLYWATVKATSPRSLGRLPTLMVIPLTGTVLGNPNAPTSWSAGGCSGSSQGSKTMRTYRADVHPYFRWTLTRHP